MNDDFSFERKIIELEDEFGKEVGFEIFTSFAISEREYMILVPLSDSDTYLSNLELYDEDLDENSLVVMRLVPSGDNEEEEILELVEDPEELDEIQEYLEGREEKRDVDPGDISFGIGGD